VGHRCSDSGHHETQYSELWTAVWQPVTNNTAGHHNVTVWQKIQFSIASILVNSTCYELMLSTVVRCTAFRKSNAALLSKGNRIINRCTA